MEDDFDSIIETNGWSSHRLIISDIGLAANITNVKSLLANNAQVIYACRLLLTQLQVPLGTPSHYLYQCYLKASSFSENAFIASILP